MRSNLFKLFFKFIFLLGLFHKAYGDINEISPCSLVYVHIGDTIPSYLETSIAQARLFNPTIPIYVIGNSHALANIDFSEHTVVLIHIESLHLTEFHKTFIEKATSNGLWRYALERFLYIDDMIQQYNLKNVFHLENDVTIYFDLNEKLPVFEECYFNMIAAVFDCDDRCIPSFVYFSNRIPSKKWAEYISKNGLEGTNDMELFSKFKNFYNNKYANHLPILIPSYSKDRPLFNLLKQKANSVQPYIRHLDKFQLIFDAAAIGQFFGGVDPVHGKYNTGFINERCIFNPSYFNYEWKKDNENRWIPYISYGEKTYPIANLHIHCKNLQKFYSLNDEPPSVPTSFWSVAPLE